MTERDELTRLQEMNAFKTALLNTAAHELNTPLTPLRLQLHLLKSGGLGELRPRQAKAVEVLDRNVKRLSELVGDILDVARLENDSLSIKPEPVSLLDISIEVRDAYEEAARRLGITFEVDMPDLTLSADGNRMVQVLFNLVSNAIKFTPSGGKVTMEGRLDGETVEIVIRDTGVGMDKSQLQRLFEPFARVHEGLDVPGTGLGLYIAKGIMHQHGGTLEARSDGPNLGSTFTLTVPRAHDHPTPVPAAELDPIAKRIRELI